MPHQIASQETSHAKDPKRSAKAVGLRHVNDSTSGFTREKAGKDFQYRDTRGRLIRAPEIIRRIQALAIPPAWEKVWICPSDNGHLQATGRDVRGRKQHRYHPRWREVRDQNKFYHMLGFARVLPKIRQTAARHLKQSGLSREKVLAAVVRFLEISLIRVGNDEYARSNKSFGLTTLRDRHVKVRGSTVCFDFVGKSRKEHSIEIENEVLAKITLHCQELPGQELFQYRDENGKVHDVTSGDVNSYLQEIAGENYTAKDFRTWGGTVLAAMALREFEKVDSKAQLKKNILRAIEKVSQKLGNTPNVCRKCYIHPAIFESYVDGSMIRHFQARAQTAMRTQLHQLTPEEAAVLALLQKRLLEKSVPLEELLRKSLSQRELKSTGRKRKN